MNKLTSKVNKEEVVVDLMEILWLLKTFSITFFTVQTYHVAIVVLKITEDNNNHNKKLVLKQYYVSLVHSYLCYFLVLLWTG